MLALLRLEKYMYFDNYSLSEATAHALIRLKLRLLLLLYLLFSAKKKICFFLLILTPNTSPVGYAFNSFRIIQLS